MQDAKVVMVPKDGGKAVEGVTSAVGDYETETLVKPGDYSVGFTHVGTDKRWLALNFADVSMSGLTVSPSRQNRFDFELSD